MLHAKIQDHCNFCSIFNLGLIGRTVSEVKMFVNSGYILDAKFQEHMTSGSEEEEFLRFFNIYGCDDQLDHVT